MASKNPHNHQLSLRWYSRLMNWYRWNDHVQIPLFNTTARWALAAKYALDKQQLQRYHAQRSQQFAEWHRHTQHFFVLSSPRSGTVFLTDLLLHTADQATTLHEANICDYPAYTRALQHPPDAHHYISQFRQYDMHYRAAQVQPARAVYGEINPFLALHAHALQQVFPSARLFHLVKDARSVLRSMFSRSKLGAKDPMARPFAPPVGDPYSPQWQQMSRFEKLCWQWQYENRQMRLHIPAEQRLYFGLLSSDYDYFHSRFLATLGLHLPADLWRAYVSQPKNESPIYRMPHHSQWTATDRAAFERICGDELTHYNF